LAADTKSTGMSQQLTEQIEVDRKLASFIHEAGRLRAFVPPFRFAAFFSPEDTLLSACASEAALSRARTPRKPMRIAELTTGSGLVGFHLLRLEKGSRLIGLDVDPVAIKVATANARTLGLAARATFDCADLWSDSTSDILAGYQPDMIACNPPYIPEAVAGELHLEAGAGADGTAHLRRAINLAAYVQPKTIALSWCSLSDPGRVLRDAESAGYELGSLFVVAIADGEYSGSVRDYLRTLPSAYMNDQADTIDAVAPDGSARFGYLLMAGSFSRASGQGRRKGESADAVEKICEGFATNGISALQSLIAPVPVRTWLLNRWDELHLRALLHGERGLKSRVLA
jgi:hypothetical protein